MLSKKHKVYLGKRMMACLLMSILMLTTARAEMIVRPARTDAPAQAEGEQRTLASMEMIVRSARTDAPAQAEEEQLTPARAEMVVRPTGTDAPAQAEEEQLTPARAEMIAEPTGADVSVQAEGEQLTTGPVLMVMDYSIVEGETIPGSSFVLQMNIANLSEEESAHSVLATMTVENVSVALQEGETNQKYYHEIRPMETVTAQFPMEVYSYCAEENMILTLTMTCYDSSVVHYDFQTMMTPSIEVARTLQVGSLTVPSFVHQNSGMIITATLTNVEPVTLNHVRMHVVTQYGEQVTEIGQLLNSESKTANCIYRFPEQQTETVQVYFSYESLYGHKYATDPQVFEVVVYDPAEQDDFVGSGGLSVREILERLMQDTVIPGTDMKLSIPAFVWILVGCVGYAVIVYGALRRKKR